MTEKNNSVVRLKPFQKQLASSIHVLNNIGVVLSVEDLSYLLGIQAQLEINTSEILNNNVDDSAAGDKFMDFLELYYPRSENHLEDSMIDPLLENMKAITNKLEMKKPIEVELVYIMFSMYCISYLNCSDSTTSAVVF